MRAKKIVILYLDNGDFKNIAVREKLFNSIVNELLDGEREARNSSMDNKGRYVRFSDGSTVSMRPSHQTFETANATHLYIDHNLGDQINSLETVLISEGRYSNLDTDGDPHNRMFIFKNNCENNELTIDKYNK